MNRLELIKRLNLDAPAFRDRKLSILEDLIEKNKHLPDQGTQEWLDLRRYNIGGSEMAAITKSGGFSNIKKIVSSKVGLTKFTGRTATRWGRMFENVTILFMEEIFEIAGKGVRETSSLEGAVSNQRYSPDGLAVIKLLCDYGSGENAFQKAQYLTVLFEFKSPYSGIPNGKIANYYVPQVMTGLCSIPIADIALFVNCMYRKCPLYCLGNDTRYDLYYHRKDEDKVTVDLPIAMGIILVYLSKEKLTKLKKEAELNDSDNSDSDDECILLEEESDEESESDEFNYDEMQSNNSRSLRDKLLDDDLTPVDFGKSNYKVFDESLELIDDETVSINFMKPLVFQKNVHQIEFMTHHYTPGEQNVEEDVEAYLKDFESRKGKLISDGSKLIGYIPYKLFKTDIIYRFRDPEYVNRHAHTIKDTIDTVHKVMEGTDGDLNAIYTNFRKLYPDNDDWTDKEINQNLERYNEEKNKMEFMLAD